MTASGERALAAVEADAIVASDPATVAWLAGFAADPTTALSPFVTTALAVVTDDGTTLVCSSDEAEGFSAAGVDVVAYEGFTVGPIDTVGGAVTALRNLGLPARVAIDGGVAAPAVAALLDETIDAGATFRQLMVVKTPAEVDGIRRAIHLADVGQAAARAGAASGVTELELFAVVQGAIQQAAGERVPLAADLVTGSRTSEIGGGPGPRTISEGELVMCDLAPRAGCFWSDSCATFAVGEPPPGSVEAHARATETLELLISSVEPGLTAGALDAIGRSTGLDYPHHTGHGVGFSFHEEPRIVPGASFVLEPGMVVALEPGTYPGPWGLRVEQVVVVTDTGCEILSGHTLALAR